MQVIVDGLPVHYESTGKGSVVVLVHGWGDRLETFDSIVPDLARRYTVVRLDLPGFGASEAPKEVWELQDYAAFIASFTDKLKLKKPHGLVGHSNGGAVLIVGLAKQLLQTDKLVLLASAGIRNRQNFRKYIWKSIAKIGKVVTWPLPLSYKQKLQRKLYGTIGSDILVAPHLKETFKRTVAQDIQPEARQLVLPVLLMYGDADTATPLREVGKPLHDAISGSQLEVIAGSDHFVHQHDPARVAKQIMEFIA